MEALWALHLHVERPNVAADALKLKGRLSQKGNLQCKGLFPAKKAWEMLREAQRKPLKQALSHAWLLSH